MYLMRISLEPVTSLKAVIDALPISRVGYPASLWDRVKYYFFILYTPYHGFFRDALLVLRLIRHEGRHDFLFGKIAPHVSIEEFIRFLTARGYGNHFVAWKDKGELVSLRYAPDFTYQYHLRIFEDGEVRGHYEYTPESHCIWHIAEVGFEDRRDHFMKTIGHLLVRDRERGDAL